MPLHTLPLPPVPARTCSPTACSPLLLGSGDYLDLLPPLLHRDRSSRGVAGSRKVGGQEFLRLVSSVKGTGRTTSSGTGSSPTRRGTRPSLRVCWRQRSGKLPWWPGQRRPCRRTTRFWTPFWPCQSPLCHMLPCQPETVPLETPASLRLSHPRLQRPCQADTAPLETSARLRLSPQRPMPS